MVIRIAIRGMAFANGQGIIACLPFPVNSHSHGKFHSSSVPVSAMGAAATQQSLILRSVQHDSEAEVGEKRRAPDSAQELPGPSVGVLPLHMIEEETAGEDGDHA